MVGLQVIFMLFTGVTIYARKLKLYNQKYSQRWPLRGERGFQYRGTWKLYCIYFGGFRKTGTLSDTEALNFGGRNTAKISILLTLIYNVLEPKSDQ